MASSAAPIRVLLVEDDQLFLEALATLLEADERIRVVGTARDGRAGVDQALRLRPDIVTMDIEMPVLDGVEATREIIAAQLPTKVVLVSASRDAERAELARRLGASAYVTKSRAADFLVPTIIAVAGGRDVSSSPTPER
jgi:DNA-binding NarL/FixJ family response regulator